MSESKDRIITIRCTDTERDALAMAARITGRTLSEFVRDAAVARATAVLSSKA